nr:glycoside hydrolase family 3 protein [Candidatus Dormibacteraeota bacterium]
MPDSLQLLADRCLLPGFVGTVAPDWIRRRAAAGLGGVVLYGRNVESPEQVASLTAALHAERPELLVGIDEEGGDVTRLEARTGSSYPGNLALGIGRDAALTRAVAASMGAELAAAGIDLDLAPDADVNSNPDNPVIGVRSFGSQPALVSEHVAAFVAGLQGAGVAACAKHFPGHGDTSVDSHLALPVVNQDPHSSGALEPFRAAIAAGVLSVMTAHLLVPSLDSLPATLSRRIVHDLLRNELGFEGLVVSDGIEMRAIVDGVGIVAGTVQALAAGCDAICIGGGLDTEAVVDQLRDGIVAAVGEGRLTEARLADAAQRIDRLAEWRLQQPTSAAGADRAIGLRAAVRGLGAERRPRIGSDPVVVQLRERPNIAVGAVPWGVSEHLAALGAAPTRHEYDGPPVPVDELLRTAAGRSLVIVVRDLHRHPWQLEAVEQLVAGRPDAVLVEMGLPALKPGGTGAWVRSHGASRA